MLLGNGTNISNESMNMFLLTILLDLIPSIIYQLAQFLLLVSLVVNQVHKKSRIETIENKIPPYHVGAKWILKILVLCLCYTKR